MRYVLCQVSDISNRKALEAEQRRWQSITDSSRDLTAFVDIDYVYRAVNSMFLEYFGFSADEIVGKTGWELLGLDYFESYAKPNIDKALRGEPARQESWFEFPAVGRRYVEVTYDPFRDLEDQVVGVVFGCRDLTDHRRIGDALLLSERRADLALEAADLAVWDLNWTTKAVEFSERWAAMLGYDLSELDATLDVWARIVHPDDKDRTLEVLQRHIDGETP